MHLQTFQNIILSLDYLLKRVNPNGRQLKHAKNQTYFHKFSCEKCLRAQKWPFLGVMFGHLKKNQILNIYRKKIIKFLQYL